MYPWSATAFEAAGSALDGSSILLKSGSKPSHSILAWTHFFPPIK